MKTLKPGQILLMRAVGLIVMAGAALLICYIFLQKMVAFQKILNSF